MASIINQDRYRIASRVRVTLWAVGYRCAFRCKGGDCPVQWHYHRRYTERQPIWSVSASPCHTTRNTVPGRICQSGPHAGPDGAESSFSKSWCWLKGFDLIGCNTAARFCWQTDCVHINPIRLDRNRVTSFWIQTSGLCLLVNRAFCICGIQTYLFHGCFGSTVEPPDTVMCFRDMDKNENSLVVCV